VGSGLGVATSGVSATKKLQVPNGDLPETRNEGEIEVEDVLQPLDGSSGLVCEDFDEIGTSLVSGRFQGVIVELLDAVLDAEIDLCAGESTVDTGGGLCGVATKEGWRRLASFGRSWHGYPLKARELAQRGSWAIQRHTLLVKDKNVSTVKVDGVGGTETGHWTASN
jgi:hypothetical protein